MRVWAWLLVAAVAATQAAGATPSLDPATPPAAADSAPAAGPLVFSLLSPSVRVAPGDSLRIDLVALNPSEGAVAFAPPSVLTATVTAGGVSRALTLRADSAQARTLAPGGFGVQSYALSLPAAPRGSVILTLGLGLGQGLRAVIAVGGGQTAEDNTFAPHPVPIRRAYPERFGAHESIYFIYGGKAPGAKFQVSLKYRMLTFAQAGSLLPQSMQFAYSQRSLWDITAKSSPFYDTSYMPALFCESMGEPARDGPGRFSWLGYQFGFGHESNGKDGDTGRSLNTLWVRSGMGFTLPADWRIILSPQLFMYVFSLSDNPDIRDYRGNGRLQVALGRTGGPSLLYTGHVGRHFEHPTHQLDLTVPARIPVLDFLAILAVQYFHGYGESLLAYTQETDMLRAGFALVR